MKHLSRFIFLLAISFLFHNSVNAQFMKGKLNTGFKFFLEKDYTRSFGKSPDGAFHPRPIQINVWYPANVAGSNELSISDYCNLYPYQFDFSKHVPAKDIARISHIWKSIPSQLGKENKKFLYQLLKSGARAREYEDALLWLIQAGLVHKVMLCKKPHLPLSAYDDLSSFKLYLVDVGLLRCLAQLDAFLFADKNRIFTEFKGALTENYILQSLLLQFSVTPRYWTSEGKAEVDFLIQYKNHIIPCEVKADENIRSKSLSIYEQKYKPNLRIRFSLRNLSYNDGLLNIPLFMADFSRKLIDMVL